MNLNDLAYLGTGMNTTDYVSIGRPIEELAQFDSGAVELLNRGIAHMDNTAQQTRQFFIEQEDEYAKLTGDGFFSLNDKGYRSIAGIPVLNDALKALDSDFGEFSKKEKLISAIANEGSVSEAGSCKGNAIMTKVAIKKFNKKAKKLKKLTRYNHAVINMMYRSGNFGDQLREAE